VTERVVLDAWALLAFLQREEPAAAAVNELLARAARNDSELHASMINMGEVYYRVGRSRGRDVADSVLTSLKRLPVTIHAADDDAVLAAARWEMHHAISYADAFAVSLSESLDAVLVTGDPELLRLDGRIRLRRLHRQRR
jgi:uncharacterized protein